MKGKWKKLTGRIAALAVMLLTFITMLWGGNISAPVAFAEDTYTDVLEDLEKDESFSTSFYPTVADDYSLQVIQIAESTDGELFVYVYQPSGQEKDLRATSINIALVPRENISDVRNYRLTLLNSSGVFYKYRVENLTVSTQTTRYYTITTIYRPFDETIDEGAEDGNIITEVEYSVAKEYCFSTINGQPFVRVLDIETIEITDKFVGFVRYTDGFTLYNGSCDSHFVAFSTDRDIDRLLEADVYYTSQSYSWSLIPFAGENETFGEKQDNYAYLTYEQKVEHTGEGWFAPTYTWNRIETVEQFIEENNTFQDVYSGALIDVHVANQITEEGIEALEGKQWVLRFAETSYSMNAVGGTGATTSSSTLVGDVTILRLKFETDGVVYNLGVIDNKQSGGDEPINDEEIGIEVNPQWWKTVLAVLLLLIVLVILAPVLPYIGQAIVWVISLPFRLIKWIIDSIKKTKKKK